METYSKYVCHYQSPLGSMTLVSDGKALTGLWFDGQKYFGAGLTAGPVVIDLPVFERTKTWLDVYFHGKAPDFSPVLKLNGSDFRCAVWNVLLRIPFGKTMTYGEIAHMIAEEKGLPYMSAQAVGGAVGHNPVSLIVPCHRVVGSGGSLTGYAGGMERKKWLLEMEKTASLPVS